ncbi:MAG: NUDIX hydrolase [Streptococcaceae bacterium]|jgi:ADP-ribose pyrophosphatase|nr:NUDIX hydrolase [Streptococcaceae bacterium]
MNETDKAKFEEKTIAREEIFDGRIIHVVRDTVELPGGLGEQFRELAFHPGGASVIAITQENKLVLVRQFRKPTERVIYEVPAGKIDPEERAKMQLSADNQVISGFHSENGVTNPVLTAMMLRELEEETGYTTTDIRQVSEFYVSPGFCNEKHYVFLAKNLVKVPHPKAADYGEVLELHEVMLEEAKALVRTGEIDDAKTLIALNFFEEELAHG